MKISKEDYKEKILKNFEIIKDNCDEYGPSISSAVIKMFKIDIDTAVDMWTYLVKKHIGLIRENSFFLVGNIYFEGAEIIGKDQMSEIVLNNSALKDAMFSQAEDVIDGACNFIFHEIDTNRISKADELLTLLYNNKYKENSWYDIMDWIIADEPDEMHMSEEAYQMLEMWCDKVANKKERASLSIKLMGYLE